MKTGIITLLLFWAVLAWISFSVWLTIILVNGLGYDEPFILTIVNVAIMLPPLVFMVGKLLIGTGDRR